MKKEQPNIFNPEGRNKQIAFLIFFGAFAVIQAIAAGKEFRLGNNGAGALYASFALVNFAAFGRVLSNFRF